MAAPVCSSPGGSTRSPLSRSLDRHAAERCPSLTTKTVAPHVLRHTAAMRLLHAGIDTTVIALWLGHEQVETPQLYLHADLALKEHRWPASSHWTANPAATARPTLLGFLDGL